jgi:hypothetical protein
MEPCIFRVNIRTFFCCWRYEWCGGWAA